MYYYLKNRNAQIFAISKYPGLMNFRKPGDTFHKSEEWPIKEPPSPSPSPRTKAAEPTVRPKTFKAQNKSYLMYC